MNPNARPAEIAQAVQKGLDRSLLLARRQQEAGRNINLRAAENVANRSLDKQGRRAATAHNIGLVAAGAGAAGITYETSKLVRSRNAARSTARTRAMKAQAKETARIRRQAKIRLAFRSPAQRSIDRQIQRNTTFKVVHPNKRGKSKGGKKGRRGAPTRGAGGKFTGWSS